MDTWDVYYEMQTKPKGEVDKLKEIIRMEVQVTPQIHDGKMKHYWRVFKIDSQGNNITLHDGWGHSVVVANNNAYMSALRYLK